jgi:toxin ParE1/3/4
MPRFRLSKEAQADLNEIKSYSDTTWGKKQAKEYLSVIRGSLEKLAIYPEFGKTRNEIFDGLRSFSVARHIIFYRLGNTEIEVARILHNRMDVAVHFGDY